jgi:hypothetical protein
MQEDVTRETHGTETVTELGAYVRLEPPNTLLSAQLEVAEVRRGSRLDPGFHTERSNRRMSVGLGIRF